MALREAFINFAVHRNYAAQGTSQINVYEDRMEFISIGGLLNSIVLDDIMAGASFCRNYALADIFYQLMLIETNVIGITRIRDAYEDLAVHPKIRLTKKTFTMILPNCQVKVCSGE